MADKQKTITENAPLGKKAERFIKRHKKDFKERYGDDWEQALYATAWKLFGHKINEQRVDEIIGIKDKGLTLFKKRLNGLSDWFEINQTEKIRKFAQQLELMGFRFLGRGSFGVVYDHPNLK